MFLIMSAAYVGQELQSEFGRIPPSFLPLGNRRLFQHQVKLAPEKAAVHLSIPESFKVSTTDLNWLKENNVTLIKTPDGLSLGASLVAALNLTEHSLDSPLHVLFGDTLFTELPQGDDIICVSDVTDSYNWAIVTNDDFQWLKDGDNNLESGSHNIVNGYFKFSQPRQLMRAVTQSNWCFFNGLNRYHNTIGLTSVYSEKWLDFGHVNTYYRSKAHFTTQRAFNELMITSDWIEKSSIKNSKIAAEANWFAKLPFSLRGYIPQYLGHKSSNGRISYRLEYLHQTALNELYVFSELPVTIWEKIIQSAVGFLKSCLSEAAPINVPANSIETLFSQKTQSRLTEYCQQHTISLTDLWTFNDEEPVSLSTLLTESAKHLPNDNDDWPSSILHGDFCFSNILYDFRADRVKTIDPRGTTPEGTETLYGDIRYDIAKLSHSVLGMYDWIIAGYFEVSISHDQITFNIEESPQHQIIQQRFIELIEKEFNISAVTLMAMQIQLFLSMLPLHSDDKKRQKALFSNAFRLYNKMKRLEK
ncbi:aminoglycoside phosphotransferase family protein [Vibrio methylphosphonaticus]|uniref:aminoglycoside phosphotransferase family protein n=1 Tax=Vibrio methylphosphonaticus TaxID=2946866 RepID=UPI00202AB91D|nr:aminoglycoside phosphotransferase family protein [Vibrio methylphosphonaticus]MCL9775437.1 aminoglycoside phosphotransferase family protein [Vibrio methylphosphonaticus]